MACNCIEEKEAELQKDTGDDEAFLSTVYDFNRKVRCMNVKAFYRGKNVMHKYKKNFLLSYISFDYCPFCGKKYIEEVNHG